MKKIGIFIVFFALGFGLFFGIEKYQNQKLDKNFPNYELVNGLMRDSIKVQGIKYLVPPEKIYDGGVTQEEIPTIIDPKFVSVTKADEFLADEVRGVAVSIDGVNKFYSYQILNWHNVLVDEVAGKKIIVTYCALCRSAIVYSGELDGKDIKLNVAGKVYNNVVLLKDEATESLWMQNSGQAIAGDMVGKNLTIMPSKVYKWSVWRDSNSNGEVLSTDTGFARDYTKHPLAGYDNSKIVYFPLEYVSGIGKQKWIVNGVVDGEDSLAFASTVLKGFGAMNEELNGKRIVGLYDFDNESTNVYLSDVNNKQLTFDYSFKDREITDKETGSVWNVEGIAISGELKGEQLTEVSSTEMFWMTWSNLYNNSRLAGVEEKKTDE